MNRSRLEIITLAAWAHGEISIGAAREILGWNDTKIREQAEKRVSNAVKQKAYIEQLESELTGIQQEHQRSGCHVWAEQCNMRVGFDRLKNGSVVMQVYTDNSDCLAVKVTVASYRWDRIVESMSSILTPPPAE